MVLPWPINGAERRNTLSDGSARSSASSARTPTWQLQAPRYACAQNAVVRRWTHTSAETVKHDLARWLRRCRLINLLPMRRTLRLTNARHDQRRFPTSSTFSAWSCALKRQYLR